jgi:hypothetical protein
MDSTEIVIREPLLRIIAVLGQYRFFDGAPLRSRSFGSAEERFAQDDRSFIVGKFGEGTVEQEIGIAEFAARDCERSAPHRSGSLGLRTCDADQSLASASSGVSANVMIVSTRVILNSSITRLLTPATTSLIFLPWQLV